MPKAKGTAANKAFKTKTKSNITETPQNSQIVLNYSRFGNIGFSTVHETVDISFLSKKKFNGKITTLFHFIRQTEVCKNLNTGKTATFQIDEKPVISIMQKSNDYDEQVFTLTRYREDGTKQSTRKYSYSKAKNLILNAFEFDVKIDEEAEMEDEYAEDENCGDNKKLLTDTGNFEDDTDNGFFDDVD